MYWLLFEPPGVNILVGGLLLAVDVVVGPDSITNIASARDVIIPSFSAVCLVAANKKRRNIRVIRTGTLLHVGRSQKVNDGRFVAVSERRLSAHPLTATALGRLELLSSAAEGHRTWSPPRAATSSPPRSVFLWPVGSRRSRSPLQLRPADAFSSFSRLPTQ